jgi:TPR repeat protein
MPILLISCVTLPPATRLSVPIYDLAIANERLADEPTERYYPCCGKTICKGCVHSFRESENDDKCPFCNSDRGIIYEFEMAVEEIMKRAEANDPASIYLLASLYQYGNGGLQQDERRAMELWTQAAKLGYSKAHNNLAGVYYEGGNLKKAKFHYEAAAMAGHEVARYNLGTFEADYYSGDMKRAVNHWRISASAGCYHAMHKLRTLFEKGHVSRESINSTLAAYNNSCAEVRSEARDAYIQYKIQTI